MSGIVVIRRCASAEEAAIVCALLSDAGITASLENWHHAMINWGIIPAMGGVGVLVPSSQADQARIAIIEYAQSAEERLRAEFSDLDNAPLAPDRVRQFVLIICFSGLVYVPINVAIMFVALAIWTSATSKSEAVDWTPMLTELANLDWFYFLLEHIFAALEFAILLVLLIFIARRFLARRAAQKASS